MPMLWSTASPAPSSTGTSSSRIRTRPPMSNVSSATSSPARSLAALRPAKVVDRQVAGDDAARHRGEATVRAAGVAAQQAERSVHLDAEAFGHHPLRLLDRHPA